MDEKLIDLYTGMTKFELSDLQLNMISNTTNIFAIYISLLFAYLALAYIEGKNLSRFQLLTISSVYTAAQGILAFTIFDHLTNLNAINLVLLEESYTVTTTLYISILIIAWVVSLVFMAQTRKETS